MLHGIMEYVGNSVLLVFGGFLNGYRDRRGRSYCGARGEILGPSQDELKR
jgi:hypothetical protein